VEGSQKRSSDVEEKKILLMKGWMLLCAGSCCSESRKGDQKESHSRKQQVEPLFVCEDWKQQIGAIFVKRRGGWGVRDQKQSD